LGFRILLRSLFLFALILASTHGAQAGIASFIDGCVANIRDFSQLGARLEASGMKEIDPTQGPRLPIGSGSPQRQRLWQRIPVPAGMIDSFTGYAIDNVGVLAEICFHVSRPGENAAVALRELKRRFPQIGETETGTSFFYGGTERWVARIDGAVVVIGVLWGLKALPEAGTSCLYLAKPRETRMGTAR